MLGKKCLCGFEEKFPDLHGGQIFEFEGSKPGHCDRCGNRWLFSVHPMKYEWSSADRFGHGFHFFAVGNPSKCPKCGSNIVAFNLWCEDTEDSKDIVEHAVRISLQAYGDQPETSVSEGETDAQV